MNYNDPAHLRTILLAHRNIESSLPLSDGLRHVSAQTLALLWKFSVAQQAPRARSRRSAQPKRLRNALLNVEMSRNPHFWAIELRVRSPPDTAWA
jgi:hypothetical protein